VYLTIGTGGGAGVLSGGKRGHGMIHPEAGHLLGTRDPRDTIGKHSACPFHDNCLEGLIAGPGVKSVGMARAPETWPMTRRPWTCSPVIWHRRS
ncbi:MAG: ROK family protein, partial [Collinsella sp.]|nr:ROK family protein [Collinsella sp.]